MGKHSSDEKPEVKMFGLLARNTGHHRDEPVLEPDKPTKPILVQEWSAYRTEPEETSHTGKGGRYRTPYRHRALRLLASTSLAAAVALVFLVAYSVLATDSGTQPSDHGRNGPAAIRPTDKPSQMPPDEAEHAAPAPPAMLPTETLTASATPQRAIPDVGSLTPVSPSGQSPTPYIRPSDQSPPSAGTSTQTTTQPAPMTAPAEPTPTRTKTVRAPETRYTNCPRVVVVITVSLPCRLL